MVDGAGAVSGAAPAVGLPVTRQEARGGRNEVRRSPRIVNLARMPVGRNGAHDHSPCPEGPDIASGAATGVATKSDPALSPRRPFALGPVDVVVETILAALRARDPETHAHAHRTADLGVNLAVAVCPDLAQTAGLWHAFILHDIGKVGMPDCVFSKPGLLDDSERAVLETHPLVGGQIIDDLKFLPPVVSEVVTCHHERWDGSGYPYGLRGADIPLAARVFSVVDAFDAMTHDRNYRPTLTTAEALAELGPCAGTKFDPRIVDGFLDLVMPA